MKSAMGSVRNHAIAEQIKRERKKIIDGFANSPTNKYRAVTKVARAILLNGPYSLNGRMWEVKSKSLGAGVYELSMERIIA